MVARTRSGPLSELHPTAATGFEAAAADYDRFRPDYPAAAVELLVERMDLRPGRTVVDLAAGTGKLTRPLAATGATVLAVEPVAGMRRVLTSSLEDVEVLDGTAERMPLADAAVDAVTVGQAFHWFEPDAALREIHRVLRPDGLLAVVFNRRDLTTPLQADIDRLLAPYRGDTPSWAHDEWQAALGGPAGFTPPELVEVPHVQEVDADGLVGRVASVSFVAMLPAPDREVLLADVRELFERTHTAGSVTLAYRTEVRLLRRVG